MRKNYNDIGIQLDIQTTQDLIRIRIFKSIIMHLPTGYPDCPESSLNQTLLDE